MSNYTPPSDEAPGVGAFLATLESIERAEERERDRRAEGIPEPEGEQDNGR